MTPNPILLVEDDPDDEELILLAFKDHNVTNDIVVARDGAEALEYLFATGQYAGRDPAKLPALVLLDLKLPKLNGLEVLKRMRRNSWTKIIPVVALTSSNEEQDILASYQLGTNSFVRKPIDFHEFQKAVKKIGIYWLLVNQPPM